MSRMTINGLLNEIRSAIVCCDVQDRAFAESNTATITVYFVPPQNNTIATKIERFDSALKAICKKAGYRLDYSGYETIDGIERVVHRIRPNDC